MLPLCVCSRCAFYQYVLRNPIWKKSLLLKSESRLSSLSDLQTSLKSQWAGLTTQLESYFRNQWQPDLTDRLYPPSTPQPIPLFNVNDSFSQFFQTFPGHLGARNYNFAAITNSSHYNPWCLSPYPVPDICPLTLLDGQDQLAHVPWARSLPRWMRVPPALPGCSVVPVYLLWLPIWSNFTVNFSSFTSISLFYHSEPFGFKSNPTFQSFLFLLLRQFLNRPQWKRFPHNLILIYRDFL